MYAPGLIGGRPWLRGAEGDGSNLLAGTYNLTVNATLGTNDAVAPDGTTTATKLTETTASGRHIAYRNEGESANTRYSYSVYLRAGTMRYLQILNVAGSEKLSIFFDMALGAITDIDQVSPGANTLLYGVHVSKAANNFWKVSIDFKQNSAPSFFVLSCSDRATFTGTLSDHSPSYVGSTSNYCHFWRMKLVAGPANIW